MTEDRLVYMAIGASFAVVALFAAGTILLAIYQAHKRDEEIERRLSEVKPIRTTMEEE